MLERKNVIDDGKILEPCQKASGAILDGDSTDQIWERLSVKIIKRVMDSP